MSVFTTIQITKDLRQKLDLVKGENNLTYNQIVENLLEQTGGVVVEDTLDIRRERVAFSLKYWDSENTNKILDISYADLANTVVGMEYCAEEFPDTTLDFVNSSATVIYIKGDDVVLLVTESNCHNGKVTSINSIVHISLF